MAEAQWWLPLVNRARTSHFATVLNAPYANTPYCNGSEAVSLEICISNECPVDADAAGQ